ncbi:hypothetical protein cypCar_00043555, partial [Cyprinus carpio]
MNGYWTVTLFDVNVILDADTAHPYLFTSDDGKQVRNGNKKQKGMDGQKDRFDYYLGALGKDGFSSGCFYFEVQVKGQTEWYLGVTRESASRNGWIRLSPENGYWTVTLRDGGYWAQMKFICLTLLIISGITDSRSEQYKVVGPADSVFVVAGEDVILPCSVKPNISVVDMRVEWYRLDQKDLLVHLFDDHVDKNTEQIHSYRGRTKLNHQELQRGNASLKLSSVQIFDEGLYKCFIQSKSWNDDTTVNVKVEGNMFISWRTTVILISVFVVLSVIAGILIAVFVHKNK